MWPPRQGLAALGCCVAALLCVSSPGLAATVAAPALTTPLTANATTEAIGATPLRLPAQEEDEDPQRALQRVCSYQNVSSGVDGEHACRQGVVDWFRQAYEEANATMASDNYTAGSVPSLPRLVPVNDSLVAERSRPTDFAAESGIVALIKDHNTNSSAASEATLLQQAQACGAPFYARFGGQLVVLVFVNGAYLDFMWNWLHHVFRWGLEGSVVVEAADIKAYHIVRHWVDPSRVCLYGNGQLNTAKAKEQVFRSREFGRLMKRRPAVLGMLLQPGAYVLHCDLDTVFRSNPLPFHNFTADISAPFDWLPGERDKEATIRGTFCPCHALFTPHKRTLDFLRRWDEKPLKNNNDQPTFTEVLHAMRDKDEIDLHVLPVDAFPNGKRFFDNHQYHKSTVVAHANYRKGRVAKRRVLQEQGLWQPMPKAVEVLLQFYDVLKDVREVARTHH